MQVIKKYVALFLFFCPTILWSQYVEGWKIDSISEKKDSGISWNIDSVKLIPFYKDSIVDGYFVSERYADLPVPNEYRNRASVSVEGSSLFSDGDFSPFWLTNNKHGIGSADKNKEYLRLRGFIYRNLPIKLDGYQPNLTGEADILASHNLDRDFYIQQLYLDLNYRSIVLSIGSKERHSLFKDTDLSSGGMTLSGNARPIPQVELSIPQFISIPYTKDRIQIMGGISYGRYIDDKYKKNNSADGYYAKDVLYHRKYGFIKYRPNQTWYFIAGMEMDTQWGGRFYRNGQYWGKSSAGFKEFFKVLIPMSGSSDGSHVTDKVNILGNVYGSMHFIASYKTDKFSVRAYHEHFFEDHSGLIFKNIPDGLYGIELNSNKKGLLSGLIFEYLHSKDQSGPFLWDKSENIPVQVSGGDNYYNQIDYISLSNYGYVVGNPLFTSPIYNKGSSLTVYNTRLISFHGGIKGYFNNSLKYRILATYSKSRGTPLIPSTSIRNQFSGLLELIYNNPVKLEGWEFTGSFGYDNSGMVGDNIGGQLKVSKTINIRTK